MTLLRRIVAWLRRGRLQADLRDELSQHVEWRAESLMADGVPEAEARRQAAVSVGNVTKLQEQAHDVWGFPSLESIVQDLRYGARLLRRSPAFTTVAVLSLAIGIGSSAAVFGLTDALLHRKLPVPDPDRLVVLRWTSGPVFPFSSLSGNSFQHDDGTIGSTSFSLDAYRAMRAAVQPAADLFGFADLYRVNVSMDGHAEMASAHAVSDNYFGALGVPAAAGRTIGAVDDAADAQPAAMISDAFWLRRFNRSAEAVGRPILINGESFTIAGVAAAGFQGTGQVLEAPDIYVPLAMRGRLAHGEDPSNDPNFWWVLMMGRLRPGTATGQIDGRLDAVLKQTVAAAKPTLEAKDWPRMEVSPGAQGQSEGRDSMREPIRAMTIVVTIVMLVACANVANLLLARSRARAREIAVRVAIGAPRRRVVRQLFTEGALLAVLGCGLGVIAARWIALALMPALAGEPIAGATGGVDLRLVPFAVLLAGGCAVLFALAPALRATDLSVAAGLQEAGRTAAAVRHRGGLAATLVIAQIALSTVLVATAALLVRSAWKLQQVDIGFNTQNVLLFEVDPTLNGYDEPRVRALYARMLERLRSVPGVRAATLTNHTLISNSSSIGLASRPDEAIPERGAEFSPEFSRTHRAWRLSVDPTFFSTMALPILRGRAFTEADLTGGAPPAVINQTLARRLFGTDDVVGRQFRTGLDRAQPLTQIVGVAADAHYASVREPIRPIMYLVYQRQPPGHATIEVKTSGDPLEFAPTAREIVRQIDSALPVFAVQTQAEQVTRSLDRERLFSRLATLLGLVTLGLAMIGLYALLAYAVTRRTPEIGVRMALGADGSSVRWMIMKQSLLMTSAGLVVGLAGATAATKAVASLLYDLKPRDPVTMVAAAAGMIVVSALAGYLPARRASRVDPIAALRTE